MLFLYDIESKKYKNLEGHTDTVTRITFSLDGKYLVSSSYDKTIKIWDAKEATLLDTLARREITEIDDDGNETTNIQLGHKAKITCLAYGGKRMKDSPYTFTTSDEEKYVINK